MSVRTEEVIDEAIIQEVVENPDIAPTEVSSADKIDRAYDATTLKGRPGGLFRSCMDKIRSKHNRARDIRTGLILLGLYTDPDMYRGWLCAFYATNYVLEQKMKSKEFIAGLKDDPKEQKIMDGLLKLAETYWFSELYEKDLMYLYGGVTRDVMEKTNEQFLVGKTQALAFRSHVDGMTKASEIAGALFVLWGVFIVGGGAMARARAKKMCGEEAVAVYTNVAGAGREERKMEFINIWDDLAPEGSDKFSDITESSDKCMKLMNGTIGDLGGNPWWLKWMITILSSVVLLIAVCFTSLFDDMPKPWMSLAQ